MWATAKTSRSRFLVGLLQLALTSTLTACGSGGDGSPPAAPATLYYVVTECHEDATVLSASQRVQVVRGDDAPVIVAEIPTFGRLPALGLCPLYGAGRNGPTSAYALGFQRFAVSPDGSEIVFEVNFEFSVFRTLGVRNPLTAEQEGIFVVHADGTGLRRLGGPSHEYAQRLGGVPSPSMPSVPLYLNTFFSFSPDGKTIAFTDRGPGPGGQDAAQIAILDIATGARTTVTQLPPVTTADPSNPVAPAILYCFWGDDETIFFRSRANPNNVNPEGVLRDFDVKRDGTDLRVTPEFVPSALPDSHVVPVFSITQPLANSDVGFLSMPGTPKNPPSSFVPPDPPIQELFLFTGEQVLQLTKFDRVDGFGPLLDSDGERVFFLASADPFRTNPSENCQVFSVSTAGDDLRQLTSFSAGAHSVRGCFNVNIFDTGCVILNQSFDPETQTLVLNSDCNPLGTNPTGNQIFAMHPDGTNLRQLTATRGMVTNADGSVDVELPGPIEIRF